MSDQTLSALAACLFILACAACVGILYIEFAAPWLIEMAAMGY